MSRFSFFLLLLLLIGASNAARATASSASQDPDAVAQRVRLFLQEQAKAYPGTAQVVVEPPDTSRFAACDRLQVFLRDQGRLAARESVGVRCVAPRLWTTYVQASLSIQGPYYVAAHAITPDAAIAPDDLDKRQGDLLGLPRGAVLDPDQLIGRIATQRIRAGQVFLARTLRSPESIQRGESVRTVARGAGFVVMGSGKALESGPPGSQIQVRTGSGRIISGTVVNAHTVRVIL